MLAGGNAYLIWWILVELFLPGSYNPIGSRLAVVAFCWLMGAASFRVPWLRRNPDTALALCVWMVTTHFFYLFYMNHADIDWVVGSMITVIAGCACFSSAAGLRNYAVGVAAFAAVLTFEDRSLLSSVFLPGMITILVFANLSLRARLLLLDRRRETSRWFKNILDAVFEGVVIHRGGLVLEANGPFAAIFGYAPGEVVGMRIPEFVVPAERALLAEKLLARSEEPYEITGICKDGSHVPIEIRGKEHVVDGSILRLAAVVDLTVRKKSEQDRVRYEVSQRAVAMRDEFLSVASHELKTPLTNIKLQTHMALRSFRSSDPAQREPARIQKFLERTDRQADRLTKLVEEMFDASRISAGKLLLDREDFDLCALAREVAENFAPAIQHAGCALVIEAPAACFVQADRLRLEQVISNLIANAIKYGDGSPIRVSVTRDDAGAHIAVQDQGIGIPAENQARIFERFERGTSSVHKIGGLGLGLYISKAIVDAHGGHIDVQSAVDQGARFTVTLP